MAQERKIEGMLLLMIELPLFSSTQRHIPVADPGILKRGGTTGADPGLTVAILCATPTFDVILGSSALQTGGARAPCAPMLDPPLHTVDSRNAT